MWSINILYSDYSWYFCILGNPGMIKLEVASYVYSECTRSFNSMVPVPHPCYLHQVHGCVVKIIDGS